MVYSSDEEQDVEVFVENSQDAWNPGSGALGYSDNQIPPLKALSVWEIPDSGLEMPALYHDHVVGLLRIL